MSERENDTNMYAIGRKGDRWIYEFCCPVCKASGKIAVPMSYRQFACPNDALPACPATYVQWRPPPGFRYALRCVNLTQAEVKHALDVASRVLRIS